MFANKSKWDSLILKAGLIDFGLGLIVFRFASPGTHRWQNLDYSLRWSYVLIPKNIPGALIRGGALIRDNTVLFKKLYLDINLMTL